MAHVFLLLINRVELVLKKFANHIYLSAPLTIFEAVILVGLHDVQELLVRVHTVLHHATQTEPVAEEIGLA